MVEFSVAVSRARPGRPVTANFLHSAMKRATANRSSGSGGSSATTSARPFSRPCLPVEVGHLQQQVVDGEENLLAELPGVHAPEAVGGGRIGQGQSHD